MNKNLQNKLKAYSAISAVAAFGAEANAQVTTTMVDYTGGYESYDIDIDGDGTMDFTMNAFDLSSAYGSIGPINQLVFEAKGSNRFVGSSSYYVSVLNNGDIVDSGATFMSNTSMWQGATGGNMMVYYNIYSSYYVGSWGSWTGGIDSKYVGLEFDISGSTHYGWARFSIPADGSSWTLEKVGYEATADTGIEIGANPVSVEENATQFNVNTADGNINITTDAVNSTVNVINMQGQVVASEVINSSNTVIANNFAKGVYIVNIVDNKGKAVSKKVTL